MIRKIYEQAKADSAFVTSLQYFLEHIRYGGGGLSGACPASRPMTVGGGIRMK